MTLQDVPAGMPFRFKGKNAAIYIARGGGWYGSPGGYDGGPWVDDKGGEVELIPTTLHSHSFDGLDRADLNACRRAVSDAEKYTDGDRALVRYEYATRNLDW